ncbi:MAG: hypothetical protein JWR08_556 [Enterovirga sp.]|jgi:hypothetical protein|nr:hypothetical protein [Enterovirga sp.]
MDEREDDLSEDQTAARKARNDLSQMWSELADHGGGPGQATFSGLIGEAERHLEGAKDQIAQMQVLAADSSAAGPVAEPIGELLATLDTATAALDRLRSDVEGA